MFSQLVKVSLLLFFSLHCECQKVAEKSDDERSKIKVGIVGAGITGLYSALLLTELGIDYEILEAWNRTGGRMYTYYFDDGDGSNHNYVDLGAMRFPEIPEFDIEFGKQNWSLMSYLNARLPEKERLKLFPFVMSHENNIFYFNSIKKLKSELENCTKCFAFGKQFGGYVNQKYIEATAKGLEKKAFDYLRENVRRHGFQFLLNIDRKTYRAFLMNTKGFNYSSEVIDWIETVGGETGEYSHSVMDIFLAHDMFDEKMRSIEHGTSKLINAVESLLKNKPLLNHQVKEVVALGATKEFLVKTSSGDRKYTDLIFTPTFSALRYIKFHENLGLKKRIAMRAINYGFALKVGLQFKTRFWENSTIMNGKPIYGGVSETDLPIRRVIYPPYGINCTTCPGAILASYILSRDAKYFLPQTDKQIIDTCLENMATLHGPVVHEQYTGKYVIMDWTANPYTQGAFPRFDPGDFESFYPDLIKPEAHGRIHFAGDTISLHHGWSNGCLTSGFRAVKNILKEHRLRDKRRQLFQTWGHIRDPAANVHIKFAEPVEVY